MADQREQLVVEAVDVLLGCADSAQRLNLEHLPLQQLFALCHLGAVPRAQENDGAAGFPILGVALVRLLDACLSAAVSLPDDGPRQRSIDSIVAAFCRSVLREAHSRATAAAAAAPAPADPSEETKQAPCISVDGVFLDASFTLLAALLARHRTRLGDEQRRLLHTAWGAPPAVVQGATPPLQPGSGDGSQLGAVMPASGVEVGQHQNELSSESSSSYFVGADFKSQVAAGQLLFGRLSRAQGGHFSVSGGGAPEDEDAGEQRRRVLLQTMAGTPAALELCAAAAVADTFPGLLLADNGSLDELTLWLQCGGQADTAGFVTPEAEPWHAECGAPAALLAEALMRHPSEVVSAVPAPLMAIAAAGARQVCQALLHAVASLLRQQQPAAPAVHDGWDTDDVEEGDADGWGAVSGAAAGWALEPKGAQLRGQLKQLHLALQSLGLDLGLLLQQHNT